MRQLATVYKPILIQSSFLDQEIKGVEEQSSHEAILDHFKIIRAQMPTGKCVHVYFEAVLFDSEFQLSMAK